MLQDIFEHKFWSSLNQKREEIDSGCLSATSHFFLFPCTLIWTTENLRKKILAECVFGDYRLALFCGSFVNVYLLKNVTCVDDYKHNNRWLHGNSNLSKKELTESQLSVNWRCFMSNNMTSLSQNSYCQSYSYLRVTSEHDSSAHRLKRGLNRNRISRAGVFLCSFPSHALNRGKKMFSTKQTRGKSSSKKIAEKLF